MSSSSGVGWSLKQSVVKGSIKLYDAPGTRQEFMFNPTEISDTKGANWIKTQVPTLSHPVYQFGAGTDRVISFELYHCGDRARALTGSGGNSRVPDDPGLDVTAWLQFWRSLVYPGGTDQVDSTTKTDDNSNLGFSYFANRAPSKVIFNFGPMWANVLCICTKADIKSQMFDPSLNVVRATVAITLEEAPDYLPIYANNVRIAGGLF